MARVKRERGVDVRSPVSWACYPSHRFLFLSSLCLFYLLSWFGKFWAFLSLRTFEYLFSSAKRHQICSKFRTQGMRVKFCRQAKFPLSPLITLKPSHWPLLQTFFINHIYKKQIYYCQPTELLNTLETCYIFTHVYNYTLLHAPSCRNWKEPSFLLDSFFHEKV